jgi:hypothetical protein
MYCDGWCNERLEALHRREISAEFLRGYPIAMFHAGAISLDECSDYPWWECRKFHAQAPRAPPEAEAL